MNNRMYWFYFTENLSKKFGTQINELWDNFGSDFTYPGNLPAYVEEYFEDQEKQQNDLPPGRIQCLPAPGNTQQLITDNDYYNQPQIITHDFHNLSLKW